MLPVGHFAVGYLLYTGYRRLRERGPPTGPAAIALGFGTQLPDLVDKPLSWTFGVLPTGRSLAHSWLVAGIVLAAAWWYLDGRRRRLVVPLAVGWLSHGLADGLLSIVTWEPRFLGFLLWPVTPLPEYDTDYSFATYLVEFEPTPYILFQMVLFAVSLAVWYRDGLPGLATARAALDWRPWADPG